jgi:hypothetical protein
LAINTADINDEHRHLGEPSVLKPKDSAILDALREFHGEEAKLWYDTYLKAYRGREHAGPRKGIRWNLSLADFWAIVLEAKGCCQVTGQRFDRYHKASNGKRPFLPSLDRIDSLGDYKAGNVELTTVLVNLSIADFGRDEFFKMIKHAAVAPRFADYLKRTLSPIDTGLLDNVLPWIRDNTVARFILTHFEAENRDPAPSD